MLLNKYEITPHYDLLMDNKTTYTVIKKSTFEEFSYTVDEATNTLVSVINDTYDNKVNKYMISKYLPKEYGIIRLAPSVIPDIEMINLCFLKVGDAFECTKLHDWGTWFRIFFRLQDSSFTNSTLTLWSGSMSTDHVLLYVYGKTEIEIQNTHGLTTNQTDFIRMWANLRFPKKYKLV